jgi:hypothetical protein
MRIEEGNIIRKSKEEWRKYKKLLGFSDTEPIPEVLQAHVRKFLLDLKAAQALLEAFENLQTGGSALEKWQYGLFERQHSIIKRLQLASEERNIKKEKLSLISVITETFSDCSAKIKNVLHLLEQEYQTANAYKVLKELSIILEKFISDLKQSTPQNAEQIISKFKNSLSEIII